jgi:hypothetical protein
VNTQINDFNAQHVYYDIAHANLFSLTSLLVPASSGWSIQTGNSITDSDLIACQGTFAGQQTAVLLVPVPEPSTWVLLAFGLLSLGAIALHRAWNKHVVLAAMFVAVLAPSAVDATTTYNVVKHSLLPGYASIIATSVDVTEARRRERLSENSLLVKFPLRPLMVLVSARWCRC